MLSLPLRHLYRTALSHQPPLQLGNSLVYRASHLRAVMLQLRLQLRLQVALPPRSQLASLHRLCSNNQLLSLFR
jgi:hypothetical protein